jgi:hypothetical protein
MDYNGQYLTGIYIFLKNTSHLNERSLENSCIMVEYNIKSIRISQANYFLDLS